MPEVNIEQGTVRFPFPQKDPIPWDRFAPLAERSIHRVKGIQAELLGTLKDGRLTLERSGEILTVEGRAAEGRGRFKGAIRRRDGRTVLVIP